MLTTIIVLVVLYIFYILYNQQKAQHDVNKHLLNKLDKLTIETEITSQPEVTKPPEVDMTAYWSDLKHEEPDLKHVIELFFEPDKINPDQFFANMKLFDGMAYIAGLAMEKHIPYDAAKEHMTRQLSPSMKKWQLHDLPPALYTWFIAAYPDVSKWLSEADDEQYKTYPLNIINEAGAYENGQCKPDRLRVLVDYYASNINNKLECSISAKIILKPVKEFNLLDGEEQL